MKKLVTLTIAAMALTAWTARAADAIKTDPKIVTIYEEQCAKCHGKEGKGDTRMGQRSGAKDYSDPKVQEALKDDVAFKAIKDGFKDKEGKVIMKPAEDLTDADIKALVGHMRTFKK
jgi:cytochrome c553